MTDKIVDILVWVMPIIVMIGGFGRALYISRTSEDFYDRLSEFQVFLYLGVVGIVMLIISFLFWLFN